MRRFYIRLDPLLPEHKADAIKGEDYPDGAFRAFILMLCWAGRQEDRGYFASRAVLGALLGRGGRHLGFLIDHRDVEEQPDGRLYMPGWKEWQEGHYPLPSDRLAAIEDRPKTGAERTAAWRARRRAGDAGDVTRDGDGDVTSDGDGVTK